MEISFNFSPNIEVKAQANWVVVAAVLLALGMAYWLGQYTMACL